MGDSYSLANQALQFTLGQLWRRQSVLAHNLANAETPGYKRQDIAWSVPSTLPIPGKSDGPGPDSVPAVPLPAGPSPFRLVLARTHPGHLGSGESAGSQAVPDEPVEAGRLVQDNRTAVRNDGNNVDLERELVLVAENNLWYQTATSLLASRYSMFRTALGTGR